MTRDQQREQEVGFLAVLCGFASWLTSQLAFTVAWMLDYMGLVTGMVIAAFAGVLVTLVVGTVLLRALRKGKDHHDRAREKYYRGGGYKQHRNWMN